MNHDDFDLLMMSVADESRRKVQKEIDQLKHDWKQMKVDCQRVRRAILHYMYYSDYKQETGI